MSVPDESDGILEFSNLKKEPPFYFREPRLKFEQKEPKPFEEGHCSCDWDKENVALRLVCCPFQAFFFNCPSTRAQVEMITRLGGTTFIGFIPFFKWVEMVIEGGLEKKLF